MADNKSKKKILVVDDDENIRKLLLDFLLLDYDVDITGGGEEALRKLDEKEYDLVLTDLSMPPMDGIKFIENAKKKGSKANFVILTAFGTTHSSIEAVKAGAVDYISKPFGLDHIKSIARRYTGLEDSIKSPSADINAEENLEARVLIVDEDDDFRRTTKSTLEERGYKVIDEAATAKEAITKLSKGDYDVTVIDLIMLNKGDIETEGIIVSGYIDQDNVNNILEVSREEGVFGVINKSNKSDPNFKEYLLETVQKAIEKKHDDDVALRIIGQALGKPDLKKRIQDEQYRSTQGNAGRRKEEISTAEAIRRVIAKKLLITTENDRNRVELEDILRIEYNVITAGDLNSAAGLVPSGVDLVIVDASQKGYAVAEQVKSIYPNVDIILSTDDEELLSDGISNQRAKDITGYELVKWGSDILEERIKSVIIERRQEDLIQEIISSDVKIELLERQVMEDPSNMQRHYELAEVYKGKGDIKKAKAAYQKVLELDENHLDALYGIIEVQERLEEEEVGIIKDAEEKTSWKWILDKLLGRSDDPKVHLGLVRVSARKGDVDEVIKYCKKLIKNDQGSVEVFVRLCEAYIRKGDKQSASEILEEILSKFPKNELFVGLEYTELKDNEKLEPGLVLADISQHRVYGIVPKRITGPRIILKVYGEGCRDAAKNEFENLTYFSKNKIGYNQDVPRPILFKEGENASLLMAERIDGSRADRAYLASKSDKERLSYLERLVDTTVAFTLLGTKKKEREDVRKKKKKIKFTDQDEKEVGYYTARFYNKFILPYAIYGKKHISIDDEKEILELHADINDELSNAPDFLYLFYTDCNFRNFLIQKQQPKSSENEENQIERVITELTDPEIRVEDVRAAKIFGYDKESNQKKLFLVDLMTLLEHEIVDTVMQNRNFDYLVQRAMLGLMKPKFENDEDASKEIDDALESYNKEKVNNAFDKYFDSFTSGEYSQEQFKRLISTASAQRHLTILADKERDLFRLQMIKDMIRKDHDIIRLYERTLTEINTKDKSDFGKELEVRLMDTKGVKESEKKALKDYMLISQTYEEILNYRQKHFRILRRRLTETDREQFKDKLEELYLRK